jgi:chromosome segregation ATPase
MKDLDMEREIEALEKELLSVYRELDGARAVTEILSRYDELKTLLANPIAVHMNMLRGEIAKPSLENIEHLYPEIGARIAELTKERDEARETGYGVSAQLEHAEFHRAAAEARIAKLEAALDSFVRDQQSEAQAGTGEYQRGYDDCIADHADRARAALKETPHE